MTTAEITEQRQAYEDANYTKVIDCPEHLGKHKATLYCQGHRYAGIWECQLTGDSDSHIHENYEIEDVEVDDSHPDRSDGYTSQVYVCGGLNGCGETIDRNEADPATDAAEDEADRQADEMMGK